MVEITSGARRFNSATAGRMVSAPGAYSAPAGSTKSICVSMSKNTVFITHFLEQLLQLGAVVHRVLLLRIEQAARRGGQPLQTLQRVVARCRCFRQRLHPAALQGHRPQQRFRRCLIRTAPEALPRTPDLVAIREPENLLRARYGALVLAELRRGAPVQLH